ncbi:hypothetical protein J6A31_04895 [bacterium]|nr:hypothetical protein [bacterium]
MLNINTLNDKIDDIIEKHNCFDGSCYIDNTYIYDDKQSLRNTPLQDFIDDIEKLLCEERPQHQVEYDSMISIYDGGAVAAFFAISWINPDNTLTLKTCTLESEY